MSSIPLFFNKKFKNVQEKLKFIQKECKEPEIFPDLKQLFNDMGYINVQITHGNNEFGKDLVFCQFDEKLKEEKWFSVVVKNKTATQNDFLPQNEIGLQITNSFSTPYKTLKGEEKHISSVIVVVNSKITGNATEIIKNNYSHVIKNNIYIWDYQRLCEEFDQNSKDSFLNNLEPHITHYQSTIVKELSSISSNNLFDLDIKDINEIFVNVQTTYSKEVKKVNNYINFDQTEAPILKDEDLEGSHEILASNKNFIIHGIPTSGKTIFLKRTGIKALTNPSSNNAVFYIELDKIDLEKFEIINYIKDKYVSVTKEQFNENDFNKVIVLIDSIDFVRDLKIKAIIVEKIELFSKESKFQVILATRDYNYFKTNEKLKDFKDTELLPFNLGQALQLVKKIIPNNEVKTANFIEAIKHDTLDSSIQKTPLALTLLAVLYRDDHIDLKELPANIFELYNKFTDIYLDRWDQSKGISQQYKYEQSKIIISFIALHIHCLGVNNIEIESLKNYLIELRKKYNYDQLDNVENFIEFLKTKNSVFYFDDATKTFQFFNHYFQEFFAAFSLEDGENKLFIDHFFDQWWHNSLVFYAGKRPKSFTIHKIINEKILPMDFVQMLIYLGQHSKTLQASHSINIEQREAVVLKLLTNYNNMFKNMIQDAEKDSTSFLNYMPYAAVINQSKNLFDEFFGSKHISTTEILKFFENSLKSDELEFITRYNIAYFLADSKNDSKSLEYFINEVLKGSDPVWTRIVYVDINFLKFKKDINQKLLLRLKRKMNKNRFLIQYFLRNTINQNVKPIKVTNIKKSKIRNLR